MFNFVQEGAFVDVGHYAGFVDFPVEHFQQLYDVDAFEFFSYGSEIDSARVEVWEI